MQRFMRFFLAISIGLIGHAVYADEALLHRKQVQVFINDMVKHHHFDRSQLVATLRAARFQSQIIDSMERPYEKKTWDVYRALFLTPERLDAGVQFWQQNQQTLAKAEKQFGVPAPVIVAIIGVETLYGKHQGNYRVLDALTTLAFDYPKRSPFFTKELKEYLLLCREHGVSPTEYKGSYAGAMGKPQFMPSSYRFYAVDFTGKGHSNLMQDDRDVIGSVANYFHQHGWKMNELVAQPAALRGSKYKTLSTNTKHADYEYQRLLRSGVMPAKRLAHHPEKAGIIELMTNAGSSYWLAYPNFYVITRYNSSPQYALVVYLLSLQLQNRWAALEGKTQRA
jgi:membrane-bound lytic murein transglycosylase B